MDDLVFWAVVLLAVLLVGRLVLALLRRYLLWVVLGLLLAALVVSGQAERLLSGL